MASNADMFGLFVHGRIMIRVMLHCSNILHKFDILNVSGLPACIAKKIFFQVQMKRSAMLIQFISAGVYWMLDCFSVMKFPMSLDVSLSIFWR